jgi:D-glycerate 3-kinase
MLRSASFDNVYSWRALQEQKLRDASGSGMSPGELRRFIMHFERLTRHMLDCMPDQANTLIDVDESQQMVGMTHGDWPCAPAPS